MNSSFLISGGATEFKMENRKRKNTSAPETDGEEEELVLPPIKIPKAFAEEFKARQDEVMEVTQKAMLEVLTKHDILHYFTGSQTPNGDNRPAVHNRQQATLKSLTS